MSDLNKKIFGNKKISDLLKEIYENHKSKSNQINTLIGELKHLIENIGDATLVVPLIKFYLDAGIKNDDLLVKMTQLAQKSVMETEAEAMGLSEAEKQQLLEEAGKYLEESKKDDDS